MIHQDFAESFPRLLLNNLKLHAERWVKEYPDVLFSSVILYHFSPTKFRKYAKVAIQTQYAVVFEISDEDETLSLTDEQVRKASLEIITGKKPQNPWETFRSDMDDDAFLTPDFLNVYKEPPSKDFRAEWRFFVKLLNTELGSQIRTEEPHFTLWDGGHGEAFEIGGQICEVKREIERWEIKHPQTITEEKIKEEKVAELKSRLAELETKLQNVGKNKKDDDKQEHGLSSELEKVKDLIFAYENDSEFKVKAPGKGYKLFTYHSAGFKNPLTNECRTFRDMLQGKLPYRIGKTGKVHGTVVNKQENEQYDKARKLLMNINKKIRKFIQDELHIKISDNTRLYERVPAEGQGVYDWIFQTGPSAELDIKKFSHDLSDDEIMEELKLLIEQYCKGKEEYSEEITYYGKMAMERNIITEDRLNKMIKDKMEIYKDIYG